MKVTVTNLKTTSWPEGTKLGQVVELKGDTIPDSLVGKCTPVDAAPAPAAADKPEADGKAKK